jgi:hypothetical protein
VGRIAWHIAGSLIFAAGLAAQTPARGERRPRLEGDWQAKTGDGIRHIMVRPDSSAQFGDEIARWRVTGDSLWITVGDGVWMVYRLRVAGDRLTISGGDLQKPVTLLRVGPATPRPDTLAIPSSPPDTARAWD